MKKMPSLQRLIGTSCAIAAFGLLPVVAQAEDAPAAPAGPTKWTDTLKFSAQVDAGATYNAASNGTTKRNFGRLFDDEPNGVLLNQLLLTAARPIDPAATGYDVGFKLQGMYGSDARYARAPHEFSGLASTDQNQVDLVEANVQAHTPWLTDGGVDWKIGRYAALEGAETLDPSNNNFYSHSYIFNFGIPMQQTGFNATWHATPLLDIYVGGDTGVNDSVDHGALHALNGSAPAFSGGVGLNLLGGNLTVLALTHIGDEQPNSTAQAAATPYSAKDKLRALNDIVTVWKYNDKLTLTNELNWIHDDAANGGKAADAYGVAQYAAYALTDTVTLAARGEVFSDNKGAFVAAATSNGQFVLNEAGLANSSFISAPNFGKAVTYGELSLGVNYKPNLGLPVLTGLTLRPEVRYDGTFEGKKQFNDGKDNDQFTAAVDAVLTF